MEKEEKKKQQQQWYDVKMFYVRENITNLT